MSEWNIYAADKAAAQPQRAAAGGVSSQRSYPFVLRQACAAQRTLCPPRPHVLERARAHQQTSTRRFASIAVEAALRSWQLGSPEGGSSFLYIRRFCFNNTQQPLL